FVGAGDSVDQCQEGVECRTKPDWCPSKRDERRLASLLSSTSDDQSAMSAVHFAMSDRAVPHLAHHVRGEGPSRTDERHTSQIANACVSDAIGSRFGMNSCPRKPLYPVFTIALTIAG